MGSAIEGKGREELGLEQQAEMPTENFAEPPDTTEVEAVLEPAIRLRLPKPFAGAASLQPAKPTADLSCGSQQGKEREGARAAPSPPQLGEPPAAAVPQP